MNIEKFGYKILEDGRVLGNRTGKQNLSKMSRDTGIARMTLSMIWHRKQWTGTSSSYKY